MRPFFNSDNQFEMDTTIKTAFYRLLLGICFLTHTLLHVYGLFYGADIRLSQACLLTFVLAVNVLLTLTLWKSLKQKFVG
jgi:hypothetical protein